MQLLIVFKFWWQWSKVRFHRTIAHHIRSTYTAIIGIYTVWISSFCAVSQYSCWCCCMYAHDFQNPYFRWKFNYNYWFRSEDYIKVLYNKMLTPNVITWCKDAWECMSFFIIYEFVALIKHWQGVERKGNNRGKQAGKVSILPIVGMLFSFQILENANNEKSCRKSGC